MSQSLIFLLAMGCLTHFTPFWRDFGTTVQHSIEGFNLSQFLFSP